MCRQLLDNHTSGRPNPPLDNKLLKKLQRHCKEKPVQSDSDTILLELLRNLEISPAISSDDPLDDVPTENATNVDRCVYTADASSEFPQASSSQHVTPFSGNLINEFAEQVDVRDDVRDTATDTGSNNLLAFTPGPIIRQPAHFNSKLMATEKSFYLSQEYYNVKVQEYALRFQHGTPESPILTQNRRFWRKVKSGIYYFKMGSDDLARPELDEAFEMIPFLCEQQPFPLLKDIHTTISPLATRVRPTLRIELLRAFGQYAVNILGPRHKFSEICQILCTEEGSDEVSITTVQVMLDALEQVLPPEHPEIFDFRRAIIRFHRRNEELLKAEWLSLLLIERSESLHGKNHVNVRLAMTEYVYVLKDQNRYDEALNVAEGVLYRGRLDQGLEFPDERSIWAMEDVAEIYDKLGRIDDCIDLLEKAWRAALSKWGDRASSSVHIHDKLDKMRKKRH